MLCLMIVFLPIYRITTVRTVETDIVARTTASPQSECMFKPSKLTLLFLCVFDITSTIIFSVESVH